MLFADIISESISEPPEQKSSKLPAHELIMAHGYLVTAGRADTASVPESSMTCQISLPIDFICPVTGVGPCTHY